MAGGQAVLAMPDPNTLEVDLLNYKVAQIVDEYYTLEEYTGRAGLCVKKETQGVPCVPFDRNAARWRANIG